MEKSQDKENISFNIKNFILPISIMVAGIAIGGGLYFGLKSGKSVNSQKQQVAGAQNPSQPQQVQQPQQNQEASTSIDDDAILGNKNTAKVAIVEFSDYECPYCKRFRDQTFDQLKEAYIDTGQAILVYRDLPLPFHNPAAEREAVAAECAREQGGDDIYYKYHDKIFEKSPGNGAGIDTEELASIGAELGLNESTLQSCIEDNKFKDEAAKDAADAAKVGISGTPGFVVGVLDKEGNVDGVKIVGAQPFSAFQSAIDQYLN